MIIIGIGHKARQGKNTLAKYLVIEAGKRNLYAKQYGFADALKNTCQVLGMRQKNPRVLQAFGTDVMRQINEYIWVGILVNIIKEDKPDIAIITDVRFENEAAAVKAYDDNMLIDLQRFVGANRYLADDRDPKHPSEIELDNYPFDLVLAAQDVVTLHLHAKNIIDSL